MLLWYISSCSCALEDKVNSYDEGFRHQHQTFSTSHALLKAAVRYSRSLKRSWRSLRCLSNSFFTISKNSKLSSGYPHKKASSRSSISSLSLMKIREFRMEDVWYNIRTFGMPVLVSLALFHLIVYLLRICYRWFCSTFLLHPLIQSCIVPEVGKSLLFPLLPPAFDERVSGQCDYGMISQRFLG